MLPVYHQEHDGGLAGKGGAAVGGREGAAQDGSLYVRGSDARQMWLSCCVGHRGCAASSAAAGINGAVAARWRSDGAERGNGRGQGQGVNRHTRAVKLRENATLSFDVQFTPPEHTQNYSNT